MYEYHFGWVQAPASARAFSQKMDPMISEGWRIVQIMPDYGTPQGSWIIFERKRKRAFSLRRWLMKFVSADMPVV